MFDVSAGRRGAAVVLQSIMNGLCLTKEFKGNPLISSSVNLQPPPLFLKTALIIAHFSTGALLC